MASPESLLAAGEALSRGRGREFPPPGASVEMDSLSSHLLPRSRDVEVHQLRLVSPDAGINNVPISSTANTGRGESLPPDFSSRPLFSGSGLALPRSSMQISIPSSSPPPSTATRPSTRPRGGPQSEESEAEAGRVPLSPLDQEALDATLGGVSKFSGLRSLVILVFGLLPLLMEIQLLLPSLTGHLDTRTWVYVHQTLNAEELTESIVVPLSTAQVTFAAQQARRRAQLEQSKAGHEPRPAKSGGETRTPSGGERGGQGDKTEAESRADSLAFQQLGEPFPILLVPQYNSETSLFKQLRLWHFFRKRSAEGENGEGSTEDDQKPRKRLTASPLLPPAPSPASSQGTAASNSYPFPSINGRSVRDSPIFPLAVEASSCTSCLQFFQPGVLPLSVASFPPASSSPFAPAESPSPVGRSGVSEASQEGATRTDLSPGASKSHASSSLPSETPEPVSATDGGVLGEAAVAFEAEREREGEREGERGSSDDKRRLRLGVMIRKHSVSPQESSLASFALPPGDAEQPSPVSPSALSPSSHGPTLFFWVDPEHYDVTPPLLLVYASLVVMMIRWFSLAVRALGEALLLQDDLDPTGAVLSSAAVSKPLRVVGGFSVWALGFCIFPYSLSATQGCMAGDMDGTNIPVPVFYAYFQYSIWVALLLALVARRLSKFFKRRASALEAEARRRRQDAYRAPSSQAAFVSTPGPVGPNSGEASSVSGGERGAESSAYAAQAPSASSSGLPAAAVASLELETQVPREHESPGQDDPASSLSSPSSSLASSAEQSFIQEARTPLRVSFLPPSQDPAATFTAGSLRTSGVEERRNGRGRSRDFTNATLLLMGYRLLIQRLCRRAQTMWSVLMWRRDHLFGSRYHAYREMCSVAAFLLSAHTISGALVVLLGPIQPWMQAVWLHILCMFVEAVARIQIAKGEERAQNARVMAVNPELFAAGGLRRPLFNVGVGARASAAAGGTPWGYAFVEEPRDRLLLKQLSSTYFSIAERIVDQVTASVAVASSGCCCFPVVSSPRSLSSLERGNGEELTVPLRSGHEASSSSATLPTTLASLPLGVPPASAPGPQDRVPSSASSLPLASENASKAERERPSPSPTGASSSSGSSARGVAASCSALSIRCAAASETRLPEGKMEEQLYVGAGGEASRVSRHAGERSSAPSEPPRHSRRRSPRQREDDEGRQEREREERGKRNSGAGRIREAEREKDLENSATLAETPEGEAGGRGAPRWGQQRGGREPSKGARDDEGPEETLGSTARRNRMDLHEERETERVFRVAHERKKGGETRSQPDKSGGTGEGDQGPRRENEERRPCGDEVDQVEGTASDEKGRPRTRARSLDSTHPLSCSEDNATVDSLSSRNVPSPGASPPCGHPSTEFGSPWSSSTACSHSSPPFKLESASQLLPACAPARSPPSSPTSSSPPSSPAASVVSSSPSSPGPDSAAARPPASTEHACHLASDSAASASVTALSFSACEICAEAAANAILLPCGHGGCCEACALLVVEKEHQRARSQSVTWLREWLGHPSASALLPFSSAAARLSFRQPGASTAPAAGRTEERVGASAGRRDEDQERETGLFRLPRCPFCRQAVERVVKIDGMCGDSQGYIAAHTVALVTVGGNAGRTRHSRATFR